MKIRALIFLFTLAGCHSTPDTGYYTLSPVNDTKDNPRSMALANVTIPELLDRPQIVLTSGESKIRILEYNRWAEPLDSMIKHVLADDLNAEITANAKYRIAVTIDEFDANENGKVTLKASWVVQSDKTKTKPHNFDMTNTASNESIPSLIAAMNQLLAKFAEAISHQ